MDYSKVLPIEIQKKLFNPQVEQEEGIEIGEEIDIDTSVFIPFMDEWCRHIDLLIKRDKETFGKHTWRSKHATKNRGFTYKEFCDLWNIHIPEDKYYRYAAYYQLGITSKASLYHAQSRYDKNTEDYVLALEESGFQEIIRFFFGKYSKLKKFIPYSMWDKHMYIFGGTGVGKSSFIQHMIHRIRDKYRKISVILIDPHGSLAEGVYHSSHSRNHDNVVYFDVDFKKGMTPTINPFDIPDKEPKTLRFAQENIVSAFDEILPADSKFSGAQTTMLQKCIGFVFTRDNPNMNMFLDLLRCKDYMLEPAKEYDEYFATRYQKGRVESTREAILGKFEQHLDNEGLRQLLTGERTINLEKCMNEGKTVIFNLSGLPDTIAKPAFGKILVAFIKNIATKRDPKKVLPCMLLIDECQSFVTDSYEIILSQMRKYGVWLVLANQYVNQLGKQVESVQRNTAIKIGAAEDAEDFKGIMKVPKKFIVDTEEASNKVRLKQYEFLIDVRYRGVHKFKAPNYLFTSNKYQLTELEKQELDKYQLEHYYKEIEGTHVKAIVERKKKTINVRVSKKDPD